jgi:3-oxoacyl-[acyl-carrier protein] reductase
MGDFAQQKILITGATGGIGYATALAFGEQGAIVGICGRNEIKLQQLATKLQAKGSRVEIFCCDLENIPETEKLMATVETVMGSPEVVVCNAGMTRDNLSIRMSLEDFTKVMDVNLKATFILNREALKRMMKSRYGRIVNISSIVGVIGNIGQANYVSSKAAIIGLSKTLALEFANRGITVNCVAPGFIETAMTDGLTEVQKIKIMANIPMARMGKPADVVNAILFLASPASSYLTGQTIHVNGGMFMG